MSRQRLSGFSSVYQGTEWDNMFLSRQRQLNFDAYFNCCSRDAKLFSFVTVCFNTRLDSHNYFVARYFGLLGLFFK